MPHAIWCYCVMRIYIHWSFLGSNITDLMVYGFPSRMSIVGNSMGRCIVSRNGYVLNYHAHPFCTFLVTTNSTTLWQPTTPFTLITLAIKVYQIRYVQIYVLNMINNEPPNNGSHQTNAKRTDMWSVFLFQIYSGWSMWKLVAGY